jgi:hypothetical protein
LDVLGVRVTSLLIDFYQHLPAALRRLPFSAVSRNSRKSIDQFSVFFIMLLCLLLQKN